MGTRWWGARVRVRALVRDAKPEAAAEYLSFLSGDEGTKTRNIEDVQCSLWRSWSLGTGEARGAEHPRRAIGLDNS